MRPQTALGGGPGGAAPTSLVLSRESLGEISGVEHCPKKPQDLVALENPGLRFPASCDTYSCSVCGGRKAREAAVCITFAAKVAKRRRLVTFTHLPDCDSRDGFQRARQQLYDFTFRVREQGYAWEWGWCIEVNPKGTGFHAHGVQHGDYVPQALLQDLWGGRIVDVRALRTPEASVYVVKEAARVAGYITKGGTSDLAAHLARNGGRAAHWSRGFLHGRTKREALSEARSALAEGEALTWVLIPAGAPHPLAR
jgi:hypothetical protein